MENGHLLENSCGDGWFAFGEFRHPGLMEYHPLLPEAVHGAGMTWKKSLPVALLPK